MDKLEFQVGKKYKFADGRTHSCECRITGVGGVFECVNVDSDGDCWSEDCSFMGNHGRGHVGPLGRGFCVASKRHITSGEVIEVTE